MNNIFVISDTHFGHANMYKFVDSNGNPIRKNLDGTAMKMLEADELMVENWNKTITNQDKVYVLGDVFMGKAEYAEQLLNRLNGKKRLVLGNHDDPKNFVIMKHFQKIRLWRFFPDFKLTLSHIPLHHESIRGDRNVHGHIHQNLIQDSRYVNVCVEHTNYTPVSIEEI